jgi:hypothetical protein
MLLSSLWVIGYFAADHRINEPLRHCRERSPLWRRNGVLAQTETVAVPEWEGKCDDAICRRDKIKNGPADLSGWIANPGEIKRSPPRSLGRKTH